MSQRKNSVVQELVISRDPEVMGGTPVFVGTRVPVQALIDYLAGGHSIDEFLKGFPRVERATVVELLNRLGEVLQTAEL